MNLTLLLALSAVHLLAVASPGPDFALVANRALTRGRMAALLVALGISLGVIVHVACGAFGLSAIVAQSATAFAVVKYLGAAYLIYIGVQALRSKPRTNNGAYHCEGEEDDPECDCPRGPSPAESNPPRPHIPKPPPATAAKWLNPVAATGVREVAVGFLTNALNPKAAIYFLAVFSQIGAGVSASGYALLGVVLVAITFAWFATVALGLSARAVRMRFERVAHIIDRVCGAALVALGVRVATTER